MQKLLFVWHWWCLSPCWPTNFPRDNQLWFFFPPKGKTYNIFSLLHTTKIKTKQTLLSLCQTHKKIMLSNTEHQWSCHFPSYQQWQQWSTAHSTGKQGGSQHVFYLPSTVRGPTFGRKNTAGISGHKTQGKLSSSNITNNFTATSWFVIYF